MGHSTSGDAKGKLVYNEKKMSQMNHESFHIKKLEKCEKAEPKASRSKDV